MKKNLLFIIDNLKGGGAERILITILQHLDAKKYNVDLFLIERVFILIVFLGIYVYILLWGIQIC